MVCRFADVADETDRRKKDRPMLYACVLYAASEMITDKLLHYW